MLERPKTAIMKPSFAAVLTSAAALVMISSMPAHANERSRLNASVKIEKADLEATDGVQRVYARLKKQAVKACENRNRKTTDRVKATRICEAQILGDFIARIDHTELTAHHEAAASRAKEGS